MRLLIAIAFTAAQIGAAPADAASHAPGLNDEPRVGGFAGVRVRLSIGGAQPRRERAKASLTLAPARHGSGENAGRIAFGEGVSLSMRDNAPDLRLSGVPVSRLGLDDDGAEDDDDGGVPTAVWIVGGVVLTAVAGYAYLLHEISKNSE